METPATEPNSVESERRGGFFGFLIEIFEGYAPFAMYHPDSAYQIPPVTEESPTAE